MEHRGRNRWKSGTLFIFSGGVKHDRDYIEYAIPDAQIIAAYHLEHGLVRKGEAK